MVAQYLRNEGFPDADRRLREGRSDDQGDIDGVPHTVIQVKYWKDTRLQSWVSGTLKQRDCAGAPLCLLVARIQRRTVSGWDAYMPVGQVYAEQIFDEGMAAGWIRMDLALGVALLRRKIAEMEGSSPSSSPSTTSTSGVVETPESASAQSMESECPRSPTT